MMFLLLLMLLAGGSSQDCSSSLYISPSGGSTVIQNPRHPARYGPSNNCSWHLHTDQDKRLSLDCPITELENNATWNCFDKLSVVGSLHYDNEDFCEPFNSQSTSNNMTLKFTSHPQSKGGRFICTVKAINKDNCDCGQYPKEFNIKGSKADVNEFPMMVYIDNMIKRTLVCGGSIISKKFVLTAAHCLQGLKVHHTGLLVVEEAFTKVNFSRPPFVYMVAKFFIHPNYSLRMNDIALIKSVTPIAFNDMVGPVCLPFNRPFLPAVDEYLTVLGWSRTSSGVLLKAETKVIPEKICNMQYNNSVSGDQHVCTFGQRHNSCQMDSGGPLILAEQRTTSYFLAAVFSFGPSDCGPYGSVSTKITPYLDWILRQTEDEFCIK